MRPVRVIGAVLALCAVVRLAVSVERFGRESLQADFVAYFTAGESARHGLSPYRNNVDQKPEIWDGIARFTHSRFLYPPAVAYAFIPLTTLPYGTAKIFWMLLSLSAVCAAMVLSARHLGLPGTGARALFLIAFCCSFAPLYAMLERGQIDGVTMVFMVGGAIALSTLPRKELLAGALFACAAFVKVHCIAILPFLLLRRAWRAALGFVTASAVILLVTAGVHGWTPLWRYATEEGPRIAAYGEEGTPAMMLPDSIFAARPVVAHPGYATKGGKEYRISAEEFAPNATLVRLVSGIPRRLGFTTSLAVLSGILMAVALAGFAFWRGRLGGKGLPTDGPREFSYWLSVSIVLMVCGPLTWMMNLVWLLPAGVVFLLGFEEGPRRIPRWSMILLGGGLLVTCIPELPVISLPDMWLRVKYPAAELLMLGGLLGVASGSDQEPAH